VRRAVDKHSADWYTPFRIAFLGLLEGSAESFVNQAFKVEGR